MRDTFGLCGTAIFGPYRILGSWNWVQNFDLSVAAQNCADMPDLVWKNHGNADFPWHWENFPFSKCRISIFEQGISISWAQNFNFLSGEFCAVCLEHHCSFWVQNLHFLSKESLARNCIFWVQNSGRFIWRFLSVKLTFSEHRISIFECRILNFSTEFVFSEFPYLERGILNGLNVGVAWDTWLYWKVFTHSSWTKLKTTSYFKLHYNHDTSGINPVLSDACVYKDIADTECIIQPQSQAYNLW